MPPAVGDGWEATRGGDVGAAVLHLFKPLIEGGRQPNIFAHLEEADLRQVLDRARRCRLAPKTELFRQGEPHQGIFLIESGVVRTYYTSPSGREITLAYWWPGNFVGGPDVFGNSINMWSGVAMRESEVLVFRGSAVRELVTRFPALAVGLVEALVFKGMCFSSLIQILGTRSVSERLAQILLVLCNLYGVRENEGITISARFTHEELAHMVGSSRQWVTTMLARLQRRNIIRVRKRQVTVLRPDLLTGSMMASGQGLNRGCMALQHEPLLEVSGI